MDSGARRRFVDQSPGGLQGRLPCSDERDRAAVGRIAGVIGHAFRIDDVIIQQKP